MPTIIDGSNGITFPNSSVQAAAAGVSTFTTSGAVSAAGLPVALNANGTVSTITNISAAATTAAAVDLTGPMNGGKNMLFSATSNVYIAVYVDENTGRARCVAGTLSGSTITWGTVVVLGQTGVTNCSAALDTVNNVVVVLYKNAGTISYQVLTISGTTLTPGTAVSTGTTSNDNFMGLAYEPVSATMVYGWSDGTNTFLRAGTVSGTSISFGSALQVVAGAQTVRGVFCGGGTVILAVASSGTNYPAILAATVSGTTITASNLTTIVNTSYSYMTVVYNPNINAFYFAATPSSTLRLQLFTVTGTAITLIGSLVTTTVVGNSSGQLGSTFDTTANKAVIAYINASSFPTIVSVALITSAVGASFSVGTPIVINTAIATTNAVEQYCVTYASTSGINVCLHSGNATQRLFSSIYTAPYSTNANLIGVSTASAASGAALSCTTLGGVNTNVTGLTTGANYYATTTGTLTTSATNTIPVGRALSATALLVTQGLKS